MAEHHNISKTKSLGKHNRSSSNTSFGVPSPHRKTCRLETQRVESVFGIRVVYYNPCLPNTDLSDVHNNFWSETLSGGCLEAGTITHLSESQDDTVQVIIHWDCGALKTYTLDMWEHLRVYTLGPAGYLGQMVFCDKCLKPSMGFAFRLAVQNENVGDLYDLCCHCYNKCEDEHLDSRFHCNIPSGNIDQEGETKVSLPARNMSRKYGIAGIFKRAIVEYESSDKTTGRGEVLKIVHEKGHHNLREANYYDSCAEVKPDTPSRKAELVYKEAGSGGKVELKAIKPGLAPSTMPVEHYPVLISLILNLGHVRNKFLSQFLSGCAQHTPPHHIQ